VLAVGSAVAGQSSPTNEKLRVARDVLAGGQHTMQQIADPIGVGRATLYRHLERGLSRKAAFR
jgi:transposase-like protein